jgi:hypothetical protein
VQVVGEEDLVHLAEVLRMERAVLLTTYYTSFPISLGTTPFYTSQVEGFSVHQMIFILSVTNS